MGKFYVNDYINLHFFIFLHLSSIIQKIQSLKSHLHITVYTPPKLVFGSGSYNSFIETLIGEKISRVFVLSTPGIGDQINPGLESIRESGCQLEVNSSIQSEPSFDDYKNLMAQVNAFAPEMIVGIGGGSVLDTAKLLAATSGTDLSVEDFLEGRKKLNRRIKLVCLPTTAGTGSEVSPNAIFYDETKGIKIGVIDPQLVPDETYIDPVLTLSVPPQVTAATGLDAMTHCIEAYVNKFSNDYNDLMALEGIRLIGQNLKKAFHDGTDLEAREKVALGSMYGGMCLGPVNTGAVHALAYPLGSAYKIAHGVSNAMLLPFVLEYNLEAAPDKYAQVAIALGAKPSENKLETARQGIQIIREMILEFGIPASLSDLNIKKEDVESMAVSALKIQRLLKNNVKEVSLQDAIHIYIKAL